MSVNDYENNQIEPEFNKLNIIQYKNCSYCDKPFTEKLWCKECDPFRIMEEWTSGNPIIDKFIKDAMCKPTTYNKTYSYPFLEWVPFDRFTNIEHIGEGGLPKCILQHGLTEMHFMIKIMLEVGKKEKLNLRKLP
jgi:hypothetical protein